MKKSKKKWVSEFRELDKNFQYRGIPITKEIKLYWGLSTKRQISISGKYYLPEQTPTRYLREIVYILRIKIKERH